MRVKVKRYIAARHNGKDYVKEWTTYIEVRDEEEKRLLLRWVQREKAAARARVRLRKEMQKAKPEIQAVEQPANNEMNTAKLNLLWRFGPEGRVEVDIINKNMSMWAMIQSVLTWIYDDAAGAAAQLSEVRKNLLNRFGPEGHLAENVVNSTMSAWEMVDALLLHFARQKARKGIT